MPEVFMYYLLLGLTVLADTVATTFLKYSQGFTKLFPTILCVLSYVVCYMAFAKAVTKVNLGIAYATWCGAGIALKTIISALFFKEPISATGIFATALIVIGCVVLNVGGTN